MVRRKLSVYATAVSIVALSALTGCADMNKSTGGPSTEKVGTLDEAYLKSMSVAASARDDGDLKAAANAYARAATLSPDKSAPLIGLSDALWQLQNTAEAAKVLERGRSIDPNNVTVLRNLGRAYVGLGNAEKAEEAYEAALTVDPSDTRILSGLGVAYDLGGDHETAQRHYRAGLAISPLDIDLQNNLAYSLILDKNYAEAVAILEPIVNRPNATPRQRQNLAMAYGMLGREDDVRKVAAADLTAPEIERNLKVYRNLRLGGDGKAVLKTAGQPSFEKGSLSTATSTDEPKVSKAPAQAAVEAAPITAPTVAAAEPTPIELPAPTSVASANSGIELKPVKAAAKPAPANVVEKPVELAPVEVAAPVAATTPVVQPIPPAPAATSAVASTTNYGLGTGKVYFGSFPSEAAARNAWIKVWTSNSTLLGNLVAGIEPNGNEYALYGVGAENKAQADSICTSMRQQGISCGS